MIRSLASVVTQSRDLGEEPGKVTGLAVLEASTWCDTGQQRESCGSSYLTAGITNQGSFWSSWPGAP